MHFHLHAVEDIRHGGKAGVLLPEVVRGSVKELTAYGRGDEEGEEPALKHVGVVDGEGMAVKIVLKLVKGLLISFAHAAEAAGLCGGQLSLR